MVYNEYKTIPGKVILLTTTFNWGTNLMSKRNLMNDIFSISMEEAEYISSNYNTEVEAIRNSEEYADDEAKQSAIIALTASYKQSLLDKGYVLGKDIEVIIHE